MEIKLPQPEFEISRHDRLFRHRKLAALKQGLKCEECRVNRDLLVVLDPNANTTSSQSRETWVANEGPADM